MGASGWGEHGGSIRVVRGTLGRLLGGTWELFWPKREVLGVGDVGL